MHILVHHILASLHHFYLNGICANMGLYQRQRLAYTISQAHWGTEATKNLKQHLSLTVSGRRTLLKKNQANFPGDLLRSFYKDRQRRLPWAHILLGELASPYIWHRDPKSLSATSARRLYVFGFAKFGDHHLEHVQASPTLQCRYYIGLLPRILRGMAVLSSSDVHGPALGQKPSQARPN
jgi:hypothetical protein